jgi:hypothetical protein
MVSLKRPVRLVIRLWILYCFPQNVVGNSWRSECACVMLGSVLQSYIAACPCSPFVKVGNMAMASFKWSHAGVTRTQQHMWAVGVVEGGESTRVLAHLKLQPVSAVCAIVGFNYLLANWLNAVQCQGSHIRILLLHDGCFSSGSCDMYKQP